MVESDDILSLTMLTAWASAVATPGVGPWTAAASALATPGVGPWTAAAPALVSWVVGPCV